MGTDGALLWRTEHVVVDATGVPVRPAASGRCGPASALEPGICWLSGTGKPMRVVVITLGSGKQVHCIVQDECKLGLVHRWQARLDHRVFSITGSPFPSGHSVCACNSLAVQCLEVAILWDYSSNGGLRPSEVAVQSNKVVAWKGPNGRQWQQMVQPLVRMVRRQPVSQMKQQNEVDDLSIR